MTTIQAQVEAVKPAAKKAAKPAAKPAAKKAKPAAKVVGARFALVAGIARPVSGGRLHAHTQAIVELYGMDKGQAVERATLRAIMGDTAVRYNVTEGKMAVDGGKVTLTAAGLAMLEARAAKMDRAIVDAFKAVMTKGEPVESVCKNKDAIRALA